VTTPVATARSPIARSLVVSIYSDHRSIPTTILVLALTQLINGHSISPVSFHLTFCLSLSLLCSKYSPPNTRSHHKHSGRNLQLRPSPTHVCKSIHRLSCWWLPTNHGR
jgi:hypothetical protein